MAVPPKKLITHGVGLSLLGLCRIKAKYDVYEGGRRSTFERSLEAPTKMQEEVAYRR